MPAYSSQVFLWLDSIIYVEMVFRAWTQECHFLNSLYLQNFACNLRRCLRLQKSNCGCAKTKSLGPGLRGLVSVWSGCAVSLLQHVGSLVVACGLSCSTASGIWVPCLGIKPESLASQGELLTTGLPGKSGSIRFWSRQTGGMKLPLTEMASLHRMWESSLSTLLQVSKVRFWEFKSLAEKLPGSKWCSSFSTTVHYCLLSQEYY